MNVLKYLFAAAALSALSAGAFATPVNLGGAANYTLLATGTPASTPSSYGDLLLGSDATIYGNVGARNSVGMASGVAIHGTVDYGGSFGRAAGATSGTVTARASSFWDGLYDDLSSASQAALSMENGGANKGAVDHTRSFRSQGSLSVFNISGLALGVGDSLTLSGNAGDQFIINVGANGFHLGGGASIILDGIAADDVLFNMYGKLNDGYTNVADGTLAGNYIAPDGFFTLGDGLRLDNVRFLGAGIQGNLQTVHGIDRAPPPPVTSVPEPGALGLILLGLTGLGYAYRRWRHE
jgi:hypothetical protein